METKRKEIQAATIKFGNRRCTCKLELKKSKTTLYEIKDSVDKLWGEMNKHA